MLTVINLIRNRYDGEDSALKSKQPEAPVNENSVNSAVQPGDVPVAQEPDVNNQPINSIEPIGADGYADGTNDVQVEHNVAVDYDAMPFDVDDSVNPVGIKEDG